MLGPSGPVCIYSEKKASNLYKIYRRIDVLIEKEKIDESKPLL